MRWLAIVLLAGCRFGFTDDPRTDARPDSPDGPPLDYVDTVLADQPVAYWRLGDAVATTAHDERGQDDGQYAGTCVVGAVGAVPRDTAVTFDGATCKILLGNGYAFEGVTPFSLEAWISVASGGSAFRNVLGSQSRDTNNPIDGYALVIAPGGLEIERSIGTVNFKTPVFVIPNDQYVHVVATYDSAIARVFADGALVGSIADNRPMPAYSSPLLIGASVAGNYFPGSIDEVAVYDRALDPDTIARHHAARLR